VRHHSTIATPASSVEELSAVTVFYGSRPGSTMKPPSIGRGKQILAAVPSHERK
jgi:hypothetical protein